MFLHLREANAALRDAIVRGETIQAKDVINLSRDVSDELGVYITHHPLTSGLFQQLANETIKAETAAIDKANLFAAQGAGETEVSAARSKLPERPEWLTLRLHRSGGDLCIQVWQVWPEPYKILPNAN
jgi:hypothetical protein